MKNIMMVGATVWQRREALFRNPNIIFILQNLNAATIKFTFLIETLFPLLLLLFLASTSI